jgi:DNA mismatch repair protein MutS
MPNKIVFRSNEILHFLEKDKHKNEEHKRFHDVPKPSPQMSLFGTDPKFAEIQEMLTKVDINTMSPVEALLKLNEVIGVLKRT